MSSQANKNPAAVLVVDDVAENRTLLVRRLNRLGIDNIEQAANGVDALRAIGNKRFDLVLLDIMMPELDGFGVLEQLKLEGRDDPPVIVISALNDLEPVVRCTDLGAEDFSFKPFNPTLLRARVSASLEKKLLRDRTRAELARKQAELNEARTLQLALVPPAFHGTVGGRTIAIEVTLEPAMEVGGDLVDHFRIGSDLIVLALGDVSDKGAGAALVMARTHALLRGLAMRPDAEALFRQPQEAVRLLNATLAHENASRMFVTLLLAAIDVVTGQAAFVRAGHVPPFLRRAQGEIERLKALGGPPLGATSKAGYTSSATVMAPGDRLLVVTDGYTEAEDPAGALLGEAPIEAFMAALQPHDATPLATLNEMVRTFASGRPPVDDMAAVLLSIEPDRAL